MASRDFTVSAGETVIGTVSLEDWDRGMGVAGGVFLPNENYLPKLHASELNGATFERPASALTIVDAFGVKPVSEAIHLIDWGAEAGPEGRELNVFGIDIIGVFGPDEAGSD